VLFEHRFAPGIADGSITATFRRWRRVQAVAGHRYRTPAGRIEVDAVDVIAPEAVPDADARAAGYPDAAALLADLRGPADLPLYRIRFHHLDEPDPRAELAADDALDDRDVTEIDRRLARLDAAARDGPWTIATLDAIAAEPGRRAPDLAARFGRDVAPFKRDVRKLKELGLTISLEVGYRLSPRGEAYLARTARRAED
jgi:hypothetical protein